MIKTKKKTTAGLIAIVAIVAVGICTGYVETTLATPTSEPILAPGYKWHYDDEFSYKIGYPEDWTVVPAEKGELGEGILGITGFSSDVPGVTLAVSVYSEYDMEELKAMDGKDVVINGREGYDVTFQFMVAKIRNVVFAVDGRYYVIRGTAPADLFDKYAATFDNAINSFVIEYPAPTPSPSPSPTVTPSPTPSPSPIPGFEAVFSIAGLLAVAYLLRRRK